MNAALMLTMAGLTAGGDPDADKVKVLKALTDHYDRIHSIRVEADDKPVATGGLLAEDPVKSKPTYRDRLKENVLYSEYDVWLSPPKYRQFWTEVGRNSTRVYFDGKAFTFFDMTLKTATFNPDGAGRAKPLRTNATHAIGYCFLDTHNTSLGTLVSASEPGNVKVSRAGKQGEADLWLVEVRSIPAAVQPRDLSDKARRNAIVQIWLTIEPEAVVHRWAIQYPGKLTDKELDDLANGPHRIKPVSVPIFQWDGHLLHYGFVNCDFKPVEDVLRKRKVLMPTRILAGNIFGTRETTIRRLEINPPEAADTFRPTAPTGFIVRNTGDPGEMSNAPDAATVEAVRVGAISRQATDMLHADEKLRAERDAPRGWILPGLGVALGIASSAGVLIYRKSKGEQV